MARMGIRNTSAVPDVPAAPTEGFWDAQDVAVYLKASRPWVYSMAESGKLPSRKLGGLRRFVPSEIRQWAAGAR
jgi:excisionase family DNA binding protein